MTSFVQLGVPAELSAVLEERGITTPTPIQAATLPDSLAGRDVLGRGRTGSGKTYAFLLPLVARLADGPRARPKRPRALVLAPTRELVGQIKASLDPLAAVAHLSVQTVFGGVGARPQITGLNNGADIVIACPGRLEDLIAGGHADLSQVAITVLDEADHMADLGFLPGVRRLMDKTPKKGQRLLFSATLDNGIDVLVKRYLHDEVVHEADSVQSPISTMDHHVLHIGRDLRLSVVTDLAAAPGRTVVFTRTKYGAKGLARQLNRNGVPTVELHGNLSQNARTRNLDAFHSGAATTLVATDIAARGIHVDDVALVVHADPPVEHKAYLHRSGRTARAGASDQADDHQGRERPGRDPGQARPGRPEDARRLRPGRRSRHAAEAARPGPAAPTGHQRAEEPPRQPLASPHARLSPHPVAKPEAPARSRRHECYGCYMSVAPVAQSDDAGPRRISHRELRNNSGAVLRAVEQGESYVITNNGHDVARLVPLDAEIDDRPVLVRPARRLGGWSEIQPIVDDGPSTAETLEDLRREWWEE
jgi:prevent-host-death family protein